MSITNKTVDVPHTFNGTYSEFKTVNLCYNCLDRSVVRATSPLTRIVVIADKYWNGPELPLLDTKVDRAGTLGDLHPWFRKYGVM
ncbi:MAG: hypothetical protein EOO38_19775, partial [Cytophagaceae bacterium]